MDRNWAKKVLWRISSHSYWIFFWHTHGGIPSIAAWSRSQEEKKKYENKSRRRRFQRVFPSFFLFSKKNYKQQIGKCVFPFLSSSLLPISIWFLLPHHFEEENVCKMLWKNKKSEKIKEKIYRRRLWVVLCAFCVRHSFRLLQQSSRSRHFEALHTASSGINIKKMKISQFIRRISLIARESSSSCGLFWQERVENISLAILVEKWKV